MAETLEGRRRVRTEDNSIFIDNSGNARGTATTLETVFTLQEPVPEIRIFENDQPVISFRIETLESNPDLTGQFFHSTIRILAGSGVMIDGILSHSETKFPEPNDPAFEGIRFQPFFLSDRPEAAAGLAGKGLFDRGVHFRGNITPTTIRSICNCDSCRNSFTLRHFHAGFSELQYFYSADGMETLTVPYGAIEEMPGQLQKDVNIDQIQRLDSRLLKITGGNKVFKYYNPLRCPHCLAPFINFEKFPEMRPDEYYGNTFINRHPVRYQDL